MGGKKKNRRRSHHRNKKECNPTKAQPVVPSETHDDPNEEQQTPQRHAPESSNKPGRIRALFSGWEWDRKLRLFDGLLTVVSFFGLILVAYQSYELRRTNMLAERTARIDQRAWVYVTGKTLIKEPTADDPTIRIAVSVGNKGKTPALQFSQRAIVFLGESLVRPPWDRVEEKTRSVIFPEAPGLSFEATPTPVNVPKESVDSYRMNGSNLRIYVRILLSYEDVFGVKHWTESCSLHSFGMPMNQFSFCETDNSTGEGEVPPKKDTDYRLR